MMQQTSDKKWFDELVMELRLRQVHGSAIGDTVASARELLTDTGQQAEETFGSAREYAAALELPSAPRYDWVRKTLWPVLLGILAFLLFSQAVVSWIQSEFLLVSPLQLVLLATPVVLAALLPLYVDALVRRMWVGIAAVAICSFTGAMSAVVAPTNQAEAWLAINPLPWLIGSALVMVALSIRATVRSSLTMDDDGIIDPISGKNDSTTTGSRILIQITNWLFPLLALVILGLTLVLN